jgi:cysteine desulfurase
MGKIIYLDNAATTQVDEKVVKAMIPYFIEKYGNASSVHILGQEAKRELENARKTIAKSINAKTEEIFFTSGGTESNNLALKGVVEASSKGKKHIITTKIEHDCILNTAKWLEKQGVEVSYLNVGKEGFVKIDELKNAIKENTILVSIIHANNEIGTIQPIEEIGKICHEKGVYFHIDACQSYTKTEIDVKKQNLDLVTLNAHKIHGPKGVGAIFIRKGVEIKPIMHGGGQESGIRSGTINVSGIIGFAKAAQIASSGDVKKMTKLRDKLIDGILKIPNTQLNGPRENRICNNTNFCFNNIEGEAIGSYLLAYDICSSTGSACSSRSLEPSHVLMAIGLSHQKANSSLRLSLSKFTTEEEIDKVLEVMPKIVEKLRKISPFK